MPYNNLSSPFFVSTSATTAIPSAATNGSSHGASHSGVATANAMQESNTSASDSLLKALEILFKEPGDLKPEEIVGLDLFPDELKDMLLSTGNGVASIASKLSVCPVTASSHISQLSLDITTALQGLLQSTKDRQALMRTQQASTLDREQELQDKKNDFSANCKALWQQCGNIFANLYEAIDGELAGDGKFVGSHASLAKSTGATLAVESMGTSALISFLCDMLGSTLRETSALLAFSKQESTNPQEKNIYKAFTDCCHSFSESKDSRESLNGLIQLEQALSNFEQAQEISENHSASSPAVSVFVRLLTSAPFLSSLRLVNSSAIALEAVSHTLTKEQDKFFQSTRESATKASLIKGLSQGDAPNHSHNVTQFCNNFDKALKDIDDELQPLANGIIVSSAKSTASGSAALALSSTLVTGFFGLLSRELSGSVDFTRNDQGSHAQSTVVLKSREGVSGKDLDELMTRACALQERLARCQELGVSAPVALGTSHMASCGSLVAALNIVAGTCFALSEMRSLSKSPVAAFVLDELEQQQAKQSAESSIKSNKNSANTLGTGAASENLTLQQQLESVIQKIMLSHHAQCKSDMARDDLNSVAKSTIVSALNNSSGFLLGALGTTAIIALQSGVSSEAFFNLSTLSLPDFRRSNDGVDKTKTGNGSQFNLSSLSNLTRLSAEKSGDASLSQTVSHATHHVSELMSSRCLIVSLSHSGALREILWRLTQQANIAPIPGFSHSSVVSAAVMDNLQKNILKVLDEAETNQNPIPGLNHDMASQLGFSSNASIASALSTHCTFIASFLQSSVAIKNAFKTADGAKDEALSTQTIVDKTITNTLNAIQIFTRQCIDEFQKLSAHEPEEQQIAQLNSSMQTYIQTNQRSAYALMLSCCVSLLCDELLEIITSRSLTLFDREKIADSMMQSIAQSQQHSAPSAAATQEDSHWGESQSAMQSLTAWRLTLSHLGIALANFATALQPHRSEDFPHLLLDDLELHTSQRKLINSMVSSLHQCGLIMSQISALLSRSPLTSLGTVDEMRAMIHSIDQELASQRIESSAGSVRTMETDSSLLTGVSVDTIANLVCGATKVLLKSSILGLDTSLSIAKLLEIFSLNPQPEQALLLEIQALSQPNGVTKNSLNLTLASNIGTSGATASTLAESRMSGSSSASSQYIIDAMQAAVDQRIEQSATLFDEEEANALGLKQFYQLLIRLLAQHENLGGTDQDYQNLAQRLDQGGIALSNYHSHYAGIPGYQANADRQNPLITNHHFLRGDNAAALLETFIRKAYLDEANQHRLGYISLLEKLKDELREPQVMSFKSKARWHYIVNKISDKQSLMDLHLNLNHPEDLSRKRQNRGVRKNHLLNDWAPLVVSTVEMPQAEAPIAQAEAPIPQAEVPIPQA